MLFEKNNPILDIMNNTTGNNYIPTWTINQASSGGSSGSGGISNPLTADLLGGTTGDPTNFYGIKNLAAGIDANDAVIMSQLTGLQTDVNSLNLTQPTTGTGVNIGTNLTVDSIVLNNTSATPDANSVPAYSQVQQAITSMIINPLGFTSIGGSETIRIDYAAIATSMTCPNISVNKFYALSGTQKSTHNIVDTTTSTYALVETFTDSSATGVSLLANSVSRPLSLGSNNTIQLTMKQPTTSGTPATGQVIVASPLTMSGLPITNMVMNTTPASTDVVNVSYVQQQIENVVVESGATYIFNNVLSITPIIVPSSGVYGPTLFTKSITTVGNQWRHQFDLLYALTPLQLTKYPFAISIFDNSGNSIASYSISPASIVGQLSNSLINAVVKNVVIPTTAVQPISVRVCFLSNASATNAFTCQCYCEWVQSFSSSSFSATPIPSLSIIGSDFDVFGTLPIS